MGGMAGRIAAAGLALGLGLTAHAQQPASSEAVLTPFCRALSIDAMKQQSVWARFAREFRDPASTEAACIRAVIVGRVRFANDAGNAQNGYSPFLSRLREFTSAIDRAPAGDRCLLLTEVAAAVDKARSELGGFKAPATFTDWVPQKRDATCAAAPAAP